MIDVTITVCPPFIRAVAVEPFGRTDDTPSLLLVTGLGNLAENGIVPLPLDLRILT
jgi:hypothetical protein